jgi:hypothetical protein
MHGASQYLLFLCDLDNLVTYHHVSACGIAAYINTLLGKGTSI